MTNFRKIFQNWQRNTQGEIIVFDPHHMINGLNMSINYNETRELISIANKRGNFNLNMEEFISLIFSDNLVLNIDLSFIEYKDEKTFDEN